jgi:hypothetical protein
MTASCIQAKRVEANVSCEFHFRQPCQYQSERIKSVNSIEIGFMMVIASCTTDTILEPGLAAPRVLLPHILSPSEQNFNRYPATFKIKAPLTPCFLQNCQRLSVVTAFFDIISKRPSPGPARW